jgi:hypothetical protein
MKFACDIHTIQMHTLHTRHDNVIFGNYFRLILLDNKTAPLHKSLREIIFIQGLNIPKYGKTGGKLTRICDFFPRAAIIGT